MKISFFGTPKLAAITFLASASLLLTTSFALEDDPVPAKQDKCPVCHNGHNPHTINIPCNKVDKYLANHPGDYAGPCQNVSSEKPPKP